MIRRILLPLDLTRSCEEVLRYGARLAMSMQAELNLLHVAAPALQGQPRTWPAECERMAEGVPVRKTVLPGSTPHVIASHARASDSDLILMPTRGHGWVRQFLLGSSTRELLSLTRLPVWIAKPRTVRSTEPVRSQRLLCGVGLGTHGEAVLRFAARCAQAWDAELLIAHVLPEINEGMLGILGTGGAEELELNPAVARHRVAAMASALTVPYQVEVQSGPAAATLSAIARRWNADAILVGTGQGLGPTRPGPNTVEIIRCAPCSVLACSTAQELEPTSLRQARRRPFTVLAPRIRTTITMMRPVATVRTSGGADSQR